MHQEVAYPLPGQVDVWDYDLFHVGGPVLCTSLKTFVYYLASDKTYGAMVLRKNRTKKTVGLRVLGPACDEGGRLYVEWNVIKKALGELSPEEMFIMRVKLAEHVRITDEEFPEMSKCDADEVFRTLYLTPVKD